MGKQCAAALVTCASLFATTVIGRHAAVYHFGRRRLKGCLAWLLWAIVHVFLLIGFERGARLID